MKDESKDLTPQANNATPEMGATPEMIESRKGVLAPRSESAGLATYSPHYTVGDDALIEPYNPGWAAYLHAFRRKWWAIVPLGMLCAGLLAPLVWLTYVPSYTATAVLRIASMPERILFATADTPGQNLHAFNLYKNTQAQLVTSDFVLISALRRPEVADLAVLRDEIDPVRWLSRELQVRFPGDAEIMFVQISGEEPDVLASLVNAVVTSYMDEVVFAERNQRRVRLDELSRAHADKEQEMRQKMNELRTLAEQLGTGDSGALAIRQQHVLQQFGEYRRELIRVQFDHRRLATQHKVRLSQLEQADSIDVSAFELDAFAEKDPTFAQLMARQNMLEYLLMHIEETVRPHLQVSYAETYETQLGVVEQLLQQRREQLRGQLAERQKHLLEGEIADLQIQLAIKAEEQQQLAQDVETMAQEVQQIGGSSVDIDILMKEIANLESVLNPIAAERERLRVELRAGDRINVLQPAEVPRAPNRPWRQLQLTVLAGMGGFVLPGLGLIVWDVRSKRINTTDDVSRGLGMYVLGTVPTVPVRAMQHGRKLSRRHQHWQAMLNESIDNVVVHLLREAREGPMQVLLVSSAGSGEGKTTLATHMAMSLARSGRRTLLVDCDLRRPSLARAFQVTQQPGMAELLLGEARLDEVVHPTSVEDLELITAGGWLSEGLEVLSSGAVEVWFEKLRAEYDFIVVDSSPIFPVPDARLIAQHADAVILSILRDVTQSHKLEAAGRILTALGVKSVSGVLTGTAEDVYYKDFGYAASRLADAAGRPADEHSEVSSAT